MQQKLLIQIAIALESRSEISLLELLEIYPINGGMEEVVEYLEIAHQPPHTIDNDVKDSIEVANVLQNAQMKTTMPRIVFRRKHNAHSHSALTLGHSGHGIENSSRC